MTAQGPVFFNVLLKQRDAQLRALAHPDTVAPPPSAPRPPVAADDEPGSDEADDDETSPASRQDGPRTPASAGNDQQDIDRLRVADLRRYEQIALKAVRAGKPVKVFDSEYVAPEDLAALRQRLEACRTADEVRTVFAERDTGDPGGHFVEIHGHPVFIHDEGAAGGVLGEGLRKRLAVSHGFSFNPFHGTKPEKRYVVSVHRDREQAIPEHELTGGHLAKHVRANQDLLEANPRLYAGAWHEKQTKTVYLDVSTDVESPQEAEQLARQHRQEAYFDSHTGTPVYVRARGEDQGTQ